MRKRSAVAVVAAALLLIPLAACSTKHHARQMPAPNVAEQYTNELPSVNGALPGDQAGRSADTAPGRATAPRRTDQTRVPAAGSEIARSGTLDLVVASAAESARQVKDLAERMGGSVISQTLSTEGTTKWADVSITVPTDRFEYAISELGALGEVRSVNRSAEDVTAQRVDLDARIGALRESVARLTELMQGAATTSDLIEAETALQSRQQELDSLVAQQQALAERVDEASLWVGLRERALLPGGGPSSFGEAIGVGIASIGAFAAGTVIVLGIALPWLLIAAIVAGVVLVIVRYARKRAAQHPARAELQGNEDPQSPDSVSTDSVVESRNS